MRKALALSLVLLLVALAAVSVLATAGCGDKGQATDGTQDGTQVEDGRENGQTQPEDSTEPQGEETTPSEKTTPQEDDSAEVDAVTKAAMASANANNPALGPLDVIEVEIVGSWARVDMQPSDKSTDAASWLLEKSSGAWSVVDFGTSIIPSSHPDAPAEVFQ